VGMPKWFNTWSDDLRLDQKKFMKKGNRSGLRIEQKQNSKPLRMLLKSIVNVSTSKMSSIQRLKLDLIGLKKMIRKFSIFSNAIIFTRF
jgi:hypothetical protein